METWCTFFSYLHSGHLGINKMDSNTTEYIEKKIIFKLSSHWQFGNISSSFGSVLYSIQNWKVLVCLQNDVKLVVSFSFENSILTFHWSISSSSVNIKKVLNANSLILKIDLDLRMFYRFLFYLKSAILTEFHWKNNGAEEVVNPSIYFLRGLFVILFKGGGVPSV